MSFSPKAQADPYVLPDDHQFVAKAKLGRALTDDELNNANLGPDANPYTSPEARVRAGGVFLDGTQLDPVVK